MNKQTRSYLQMQLEEATLDSGRYNDDYAVYHQVPTAETPLLNAYRRAVASLGMANKQSQSKQQSASAN